MPSQGIPRRPRPSSPPGHRPRHGGPVPSVPNQYLQGFCAFFEAYRYASKRAKACQAVYSESTTNRHELTRIGTKQIGKKMVDRKMTGGLHKAPKVTESTTNRHQLTRIGTHGFFLPLQKAGRARQAIAASDWIGMGFGNVDLQL